MSKLPPFSIELTPELSPQFVSVDGSWILPFEIDDDNGPASPAETVEDFGLAIHTNSEDGSTRVLCVDADGELQNTATLLSEKGLCLILLSYPAVESFIVDDLNIDIAQVNPKLNMEFQNIILLINRMVDRVLLSESIRNAIFPKGPDSPSNSKWDPNRYQLWSR